MQDVHPSSHAVELKTITSESRAKTSVMLSNAKHPPVRSTGPDSPHPLSNTR